MQKKLWRKGLVLGIIVLFVGTHTLQTITCISASIEKHDEVKIKRDFPATGFFYVDTDENDVWWFINSTGEKNYLIGAGGIDIGPFYYGDSSDWANTTRKQLENWNINIGGKHSFFPDMPYYCRFRFKNIVGVKGWTHTRTPDVFDIDWQQNVSDAMNKFASPLKDDPNLIGYYTDNEMKWGPDATGDGVHGDPYTFIEVYMAAPATTPGKQRLVRFFMDQYNNNITVFNKVWNMEINNFNELLNYTELGVKDGWRLRSKLITERLKLLSDYPFFKEEPYILERAINDVKEFSRLVAEKYFDVTDTALNVSDPNHLNLGVRFHLQGVPEEVLEVCGEYVDVISINYYRFNKYMYDPIYRRICKKFGTVPLDNWMYKYNNKTNKPLFLSEYHCVGNDGSWPNFLETILYPTKVRTQQRRADIFKWYTMNCYNCPYVVGQNWFLYRDSMGSNWGMVDFWDKPYGPLETCMPEIFSKAVEIHENASYDQNSINEIFDMNFLSTIESIFYGINIPIEQKNTDFNNEYNVLDAIIETKNRYQHYPHLKYNNNYGDGILYVGGIGPNNYTSIQDAINDSFDGYTVFVYSGTYIENIIINKSIALIGEDNRVTVIDALYEDTVFGDPKPNIVVSIEADNVTITEFNITSHGGYMGSSSPFACQGIYLKGYDNCIISSNIFTDLNKWGVQSLKSNNTEISNNIFYDIDGCGIIMDSSNNVIVENNYIGKNGLYGIWMSLCRDNVLQNNIITDSVFGVILIGANYNKISENSIIENEQKSICLRESNNNIISSNNFIDNPTSTYFFYSQGNKWDGNYWGRSRVLPKIISGRKGEDGLIPCLNFDWNPASEPYDI